MDIQTDRESGYFNARRAQAITTLASNLMRIASGGTAGSPVELFAQCVEYIKAEAEGQENGFPMMTDNEIRRAMDWQGDDRWKPNMTPEQSYSYAIDNSWRNIQNAALRIAAYRLTGSKCVPFHRAESEFHSEIWQIADMQGKFRR